MVRSDFVQGKRARLQYFEHGTGSQVIVFVHGYASSGRGWKLTQEAFDPHKYRTIAINNRGAGDSDRSPSEEDYTVQSFALDLVDAVTTLGLGDFTLIGHSLGGTTVAQFALDNPSLAKALVLLASNSLQGHPLVEGWEAQIREQFRLGPPSLELGSDTANVPAEVIESIRADVARNPIERALGGRRSQAALRLRESVHEIKVPVLVVGGDVDERVEMRDVLLDYLALSEEQRYLHIFHGVGHSPNLEIPQELASLIASFIDRVDALRVSEVIAGKI